MRNDVTLAFDRGTLLLSGCGESTFLRHAATGSAHTGRAAAPPPGTWDERVSAWRFDAIDYLQVRQDLARRFGAAFKDEVPQPVRLSWPAVSLPTLRPEQAEAVAAWTKAGCRGQIVMPTGTGKTEVALAAMAVKLSSQFSPG